MKSPFITFSHVTSKASEGLSTERISHCLAMREETVTENSRVSFQVILLRLTSFGDTENSCAPVARKVSLVCGSTGSVPWMSSVACLPPVILFMSSRVTTVPVSFGPIVILVTFSSFSGCPAARVTRTRRF